jgi:hypothetical protein
MTTGIMTQQRIENFWAKVDKTPRLSGCWLWTGAKQGGQKGRYGAFQMGWKTQKRAHRVAYELVSGPIPEGLMICHSCDTPLCVNPSHLFAGNAKINTQDMIQKGRKALCFGTANGIAKLTDQEVRKIYLDSRTNVDIAADYGISSSLISLIRQRKIRSNATINLPDQPRRKPGAGSSAYQAKIQRLSNTTIQQVTQ